MNRAAPAPIRHAGHVRATLPALLALILSCGPAACVDGGAIPSRYLKQAEPGVTLTALSKDPAGYQGKVVILGGVIVKHEQGDNRVWLHVKNRPLDGDYVPHIPPTREGPEAGLYWVSVRNKDLPGNYRHWTRVTVVGRVQSGQTGPNPGATGQGVVLSALYLRGWGKDLGGYLAEEDDHGLARPPSLPEELQVNSTP